MSEATSQDIPPALWLQWHGDGDPDDTAPVGEREVTWAREQVFPQDIPYIRATAVATGTEQRVCEDIAERQVLGVQKYGTTVAENPAPLRAWLQHAYEECLDMAIYLRRSMDEIDNNPTP